MGRGQLVLHTCRRWRGEFEGRADERTCDECGHKVAVTVATYEARQAYCNAIGAELRIACDECAMEIAAASSGPVVVYVPQATA